MNIKALRTYMVLFLITMVNASYAQNVLFYLNQIWCDKTTEHGQDEVYFISNYRYSNGASGQIVTAPHDINDNGNIRWFGGLDFFRGPLPSGTYVDITIFIMEQDGGGSQQIINTAQTAMNTLTPAVCTQYPPACPYATALAGVVNFVANLPSQLQNIIQDTDDYIGSVTVRLYNNNGYLSYMAYSSDRCVGFVPANQSPNQTLIALFNGDGSSYKMTASATFVQ